MAKTEQTLELERAIYNATKKQGVFGCFEVTIGWFGNERVDYLTYDTNGIWRCYEIKVSKSDFNSKAHITFCGHYNYYVIPYELYKEVKDNIPSNVGVWVGDSVVSSVKKAKKQDLLVDEQILKNSMIRSLCREFDMYFKSEDPAKIRLYQREISRLTKERNVYKDKLYKCYSGLSREEMKRIYGDNYMDIF